MRCQHINVEIDRGVYLHLGSRNEEMEYFVSRAYVKLTPFEARRLAADLMDAAADVEAIEQDEKLDQADAVPAERLEKVTLKVTLED